MTERRAEDPISVLLREYIELIKRADEQNRKEHDEFRKQHEESQCRHEASEQLLVAHTQQLSSMHDENALAHSALGTAVAENTHAVKRGNAWEIGLIMFFGIVLLIAISLH